MTFLEDNIKEHVKKILFDLKNTVNILFFTQEFECSMCHQARLFLLDFIHASDKLNLKIHDFEKDADIVKKYKIDKIPAIILLDSKNKDTGIRFYGIPSGYQINSFLSALLGTSGKKDGIQKNLIKRIKTLKKNIHIQVFVTLGCSYCPNIVMRAHRLALENSKIKADMIETTTFPHLAVKYNVQSIPKIIINETRELIGVPPMNKFLDEIEKI